MRKQLTSARGASESERAYNASRWPSHPKLLVAILLVLVSLGFFWVRGDRNHREAWGEGVNVVLISLDTTRRDRFSCYGYACNTTPHMDAVAREALVFRHATAVSNWTLPTHASMLTGLYPTSHGAHVVKQPQTRLLHEPPTYVDASGSMHDSCETLAEMLRAQGYRTGAVVANATFLQKAYGLDQGFDRYDDRCTCADCSPDFVDVRVPYRDAADITREAVQWLDKERERPFFLFLNYFDPHAPYFPPPPYDKRFGDERADRIERELPRARSWRMHANIFSALQANLSENPSRRQRDALAWLSAQHDGELAFVDEQVGRLVQWLRDQGIYDRTLIVITSDHGECFGEHGLLEHGQSFYEPELAVPLIVKLPHQAQRGWSDHAVSHVDIMPTVLESLGMTVPATVQGRSMLSWQGDRDRFAEKHVLSETQATHQYALYRGRLKCIEDTHGNIALYDLEKDPQEMHNLAQERRAVAESLREALADWKELVVPIESIAPAHLRPENSQLLRDFGYLQ